MGKTRKNKEKQGKIKKISFFLVVTIIFRNIAMSNFA